MIKFGKKKKIYLYNTEQISQIDSTIITDFDKQNKKLGHKQKQGTVWLFCLSLDLYPALPPMRQGEDTVPFHSLPEKIRGTI